MRGKSHICFWTRGSFDSTLTIRAQQLGLELSKRGWVVSYIVDDLPGNDDATIDWAAEVVRIPVRPLMAMAKATSVALKQLQPDYVHILNPSPSHLLVLGRKDKPPIIGDWEDAHALTHRGVRQKVDAAVERWFLRRAAVVVAVSRYLQQRFSKMGRPDAAYIPYGLLPRQFPDGPSPFGQPTAVWMGSFYREVELRFLVQIARRLIDWGDGLPLTMVGGGPLWKLIDEQRCMENVNNLCLTGRLPWDEMLLHLRHAAVLLLPLEDNLDNRTRCPFKALQYAQAGRPIIATPVGDIPELLGDGPLYTSFAVDAFTEATSELMRHGLPKPVRYDLSLHSWANRAAVLAGAIKNYGKRQS